MSTADDEKIIKEFDLAAPQMTVQAYRFIYRPRLVFSLLRRLTPALMAKDKVKMESVIEKGYVIRNPAAIVFIVGYKWISHSEASAQYALGKMILYGQAKGIGSCLWGGGKMALDRSKAVRKRMGLPKGESILGALMLGYPAVKFRNKVQGKSLPIQWNAG